MEEISKQNIEGDDIVLWNQIIEGNSLAFDSLFKKYYKALFNYGKTLVVSHEQVKDAIQDSFADIWIYRKNLNKDVVVKAYLFSILRKRLARLYNKDKIFRLAESIDNLEFSIDFTIESELINSESKLLEIKQLNELINKLPARKKETLYLRYHQGLSIEQISEILNINHQSVKNIIYRTITQLRAEWKSPLLVLLSYSTTC